jgi:hypothetical protein
MNLMDITVLWKIFPKLPAFANLLRIKIYYYPGSTQKPEFKQFESLRIRLLFSEYESKNQATVEFVKGNDFQSFTYEYNNRHWNIVSQETHNHYNQ